MKKLFILATSTILFSSIFVACNNEKSNQLDNLDFNISDTLTTELMSDSSTRIIVDTLYNLGDSITLERYVAFDYPVGKEPAALINSIREWIFDELNSQTTDPQKALAELVKNSGEEEYETQHCVKICKEYEDQRIVTYYNHGEFMNYLAAHGWSYFTGKTFRKVDGKQLGWNIFSTDRETNEPLKKIVTQSLFEYFNAKNWEELKNMIFESDTYTESAPLPITDPLVIGDSLLFVYQSYEIAPYSAGKPSVKIACNDVKELMTPSARRLLCKD